MPNGWGIRRLGCKDLDAYLSDDWIAGLADASATDADCDLTCHRWLADSPAKRLVYSELYGDLLHGEGQRVLDIGGGLTSLTRILAERHDYVLNELMAHETVESVRRFRDSSPSFELREGDWYDLDLGDRYDIVVANDIFPNVDQRLDLFLPKVLPICREVRLLVTYYNHPRFYFAKRIDGEEVFCMRAWNGEMTGIALRPFVDRMPAHELDDLHVVEDSIFPNQRQVCIVKLAGRLSPGSD